MFNMQHFINSFKKKETINNMAEESSKTVYLFKFFKSIPERDTIAIFKGVYDEYPEGKKPDWIGTAGALSMYALGAHNVAGEYWSAFTLDKQWVGTSEF